MRRNLLLLFSLILAPLAMHATPTFQANGYGQFFCGEAAPRPGFGNELDIHISGSDGQGNSMWAALDVGQLAGLPTCTPTLPSLSVDANSFNPNDGGGMVNYDRVSYKMGFYSDCSSSVSNVGCAISFTSSGSGRTGSIDVALNTWDQTFGNDGQIINETNFRTVDIAGTVDFTSLGMTEKIAYPGTNPNDLVPFATGTFTLGDGKFTDFVPEPAAFGLMTCAAPLLFVYIKRQRRSIA